MTGLLLMALASFGFVTTEPQTAEVTCTATVPGVTFGIGTGLMCFHYRTTCDGTVADITINGSYSGLSSGSGTKTCNSASSCEYVRCTPFKRGTWTFTNDTTYTGGTDSATGTVTF